MARKFSRLRTQTCDILALLCFYYPIIAHCAVVGFSFTSSTYFRHSSHTLFTAHAFRTHVKASQTDLHAKPDIRQDLPTIARQKGINARKRRSSIKQHRKASRTPSRERSTQAKHEPTLLHASFRSRIETKTRRAASRPRRHPPRCLSHGRSLEGIRSDSMAPCHCHRSLSRLGSDRSRLSTLLGWDWLASGPRYGSQRGAVLL